MQKRFLDFIQKEQLIEKGDKIVVGVSGGADSVCLLYLLNSIKEEYRLQIQVVHVHHGLRGEEADRDAAFAEELAGRWNLSFCVVKKEVRKLASEHKMTEEEMGRKVRYDAFEKLAEEINADKIALAHHQNDQAETVLFQLFRGSGARGLAGMPLCRGKIIRPLLFATREEIEDCLQQAGISFCTDTTNSSMKYSRNIIRNQLLPLAEEQINEQAVRHIAQAAGVQAKWRSYIEKQAKEAYQRVAKEENDCLRLNLELLNQEEEVIQEEIFTHAFCRIIPGAKDVDQIHYELVKKLCTQESGKGVDLPQGIRCEKRYQELVFYRVSEENEAAVYMPCEVDATYEFAKMGTNYELTFSVKKREELPSEIPQKDYTKWFDYDMIKSGLVLRGAMEMDYFVLDQEGRKKKLFRHFIDKKIPRSERANQLVLADEHHIIWVLFDRISDAYKVRATTKNVLIVSVREI